MPLIRSRTANPGAVAPDVPPEVQYAAESYLEARRKYLDAADSTRDASGEAARSIAWLAFDTHNAAMEAAAFALARAIGDRLDWFPVAGHVVRRFRDADGTLSPRVDCRPSSCAYRPRPRRTRP